MRTPLFVRDLTLAERHAIEAGLRSSNSFPLRRCHILLASSRGQRARQIADSRSCDDQTVRNAIHAFNTHGLTAILPGSTVAQRLPHAIFDAPRRERLRALLHHSPRTFGYSTSVWTLLLVANVAYAEGITPRHVSSEAIRLARKHLGVSWKRAKHWITSPDPAYVRKKTHGTACSA
jgi:transposase